MSGGDRRWWLVAYAGQFAKCVNGEMVSFELNAKTFREIEANFRRKPAAARKTRVDFEHMSERMPGDVALTGAPAQGWIHDLKVDSEGLHALVELLEPALSYVRDGKYSSVSPAIRLNPPDETGRRNGAVLSSLALTNDNFLQKLPPIAATNDGQEVIALVFGDAVKFTRAPASKPAPVVPVRTYEQRVAGMALLLMKSGERYADAMREAREIVPLSANDSNTGNEGTIMSKSVRADVEAAYEALYPKPTYETCGGGKPNPKEYVANHDLGSYAAALAKWEREVLAPLVAQWVKARDIEVDRVLGGDAARAATERGAATGGRAGELAKMTGGDDGDSFLLTCKFDYHVSVIQQREGCDWDRAFNLAYEARKAAEAAKDRADLRVEMKAAEERTGDAADCFNLTIAEHVDVAQKKHRCSRDKAYKIVSTLRDLHGSSNLRSSSNRDPEGRVGLDLYLADGRQLSRR